MVTRPPSPEDFNVSESDIERYESVVYGEPSFPDNRLHQILFLIASSYCVAFVFLRPDSDSWGGFLVFAVPMVLWHGLNAVPPFIGWIIDVIRYPRIKRNGPSPETIARINEYLSEKHRYEVALWQQQREQERALEAARRRQEAFWRKLSPYAFEVEIQDLYQRMGYFVIRTGGAGDEGVDLLLRKDAQKIIVQCKQHEKPLSPGAARDLLGTIIHHEATAGILICTGGFSQATKQFARGKPMTLVGLYDIIKMCDGLPPNRR